MDNRCDHTFLPIGGEECAWCRKTPREIELETTLSEVLAVFRDEDVTITEEMKARWLQTLNKTSSTTAN